MSASRVAASSIAQGLPKSRSLLAGNYAYGGGATWLIERIDVGSAGAASVTFSSIPQTFKHLQVRCTVRDTYTGTGTPSLGTRFNGDSSASYTYHALYGTGSSAVGTGATGYTYSYGMNSAGDGATASVYNANVMDILDYTSTNKYKTTRTLSGVDYNTASYSSYAGLYTTLWLNTAAITSIAIYPNVLHKQYSTFALYGVVG